MTQICNSSSVNHKPSFFYNFPAYISHWFPTSYHRYFLLIFIFWFRFLIGMASVLPSHAEHDAHQLRQPAQQHFYTEGTIFVAAAAIMGTVIVALLLWNIREIAAYMRCRVQPLRSTKEQVTTVRPSSSGNNSLGFRTTLSAARLESMLDQTRSAIGSTKISSLNGLVDPGVDLSIHPPGP